MDTQIERAICRWSAGKAPRSPFHFSPFIVVQGAKALPRIQPANGWPLGRGWVHGAGTPLVMWGGRALTGDATANRCSGAGILPLTQSGITKHSPGGVAGRETGEFVSAGWPEGCNGNAQRVPLPR